MIFGNSWIFGWNFKFMITLPLSDMLLQTLSIQNLVHLSANSFGINGFSLSSGFLNLKMKENEFRAFQIGKFIWNFEKYPTKLLQFGMQIKNWHHNFLAPLCISCKLFTGYDHEFLISFLSKNCKKCIMEFGIRCRILWTAYYWLMIMKI